jgi:hypothetical protein
MRTNEQVSAAAPELTRRQLEYWVEMGWVVPDGEQARGHPREFSETELKVLATMYRLAAAGFPARNAAWIARKAVTSAGKLGSATVLVDLVPGVRVEVEI